MHANMYSAWNVGSDCDDVMIALVILVNQGVVASQLACF